MWCSRSRREGNGDALLFHTTYALVRAEEVASGIAAEPADRRKDPVAVLIGGLDVCSLHAGSAERAFWCFGHCYIFLMIYLI